MGQNGHGSQNVSQCRLWIQLNAYTRAKVETQPVVLAVAFDGQHWRKTRWTDSQHRTSNELFSQTFTIFFSLTSNSAFGIYVSNVTCNYIDVFFTVWHCSMTADSIIRTKVAQPDNKEITINKYSIFHSIPSTDVGSLWRPTMSGGIGSC